ncbi:MAG: hypothetical protein E6R03_18235 [Hyphomicrobiaceae bacterium]|nr:MAG: hypothetical protein E6R03_18235 [Hyphomicrobiaceae bacterium]
MDRDSMDRINVRTSDAIDVWLFRVEKECVRHGLKSKGKKLRKEQIINGIIAKVMSAGMGQTIASIKEGVPIYEEQLRQMGFDDGKDGHPEGAEK